RGPASLLHVGLSAAAGVCSATSSFASAASSPSTATASGGTDSVDASFTWTVTATNQAPTTTGIANQSNAEGATVSLDVSGSFSDADGDSLTLGTASLLPDGVSFAAGVFSGTLSFISAGSYPITVSASDGNGGSVDASFTWLVTDVFTVTASSGGNGTITPASQTVAFDGTA